MSSLRLIKRLPLNSIVKRSSNLRLLSTQIPLKNIPTPTDPNSNEKIPFAIERELPEIPNNRNKYIAYAVLGLLGWVGALGVLTNYQKQNTSITNSTLFICKYEPNSVEALGDDIDFQQSWPWISGYINHLKGKIDISYWVKGSKDTGKLHFRAIRKVDQWIPMEFTITLKDGRVISLLNTKSVTDLVNSEEMNAKN